MYSKFRNQIVDRESSTTLEVKNDHAHVITQDICNKFIEIKFSVGCMLDMSTAGYSNTQSTCIDSNNSIDCILGRFKKVCTEGQM